MAEFTLERAPLRARTRAALAQPLLRQNLRRATDRFMQVRAAAFAQLADAEALRATARALRARTLARLPELLEQFADRLLARGAHVHWASDAASARRYIGQVAARHGVRKVVKSKSMASEEIGLNRYLEGLGVQVVETDLGEWIIQLADETPSHILAPAIHKDRRQIAALFGQVAGSPLPEEPARLTAFARARLREEFLSADMGISGVNFGVAASGSLVLVTNEGNGRLVTSLPRVHVAVMGMERLVADLAELDVLLALLARSATGQPLSCYTSIISGPRRAEEADGPEELHVVILDNGRSALLGSEFQEALHCIRCGACLNVCPVYRQIGGHAYGWVYSGPIGAVLTPLLLPASAAAQELPRASSLCGACWQACPVGIPLQDLLLALRRRRPPEGAAERLVWRAWARLWASPRLYRWSLRALHALAPLARLPGVGRLPLVSRWAAGRALPSLPSRGFRDWWRENG
jgi:L-lactate dehydrogenase complex protein LldF